MRQVHEGVISTYWGQVRAMKKMVENGDRTALILEDDVDVEWDLERLWEGVRRRLPKKKESGEEDWDVTLLGHCWGGESQSASFSSFFTCSLTPPPLSFLSLLFFPVPSRFLVPLRPFLSPISSSSPRSFSLPPSPH